MAMSHASASPCFRRVETLDEKRVLMERRLASVRLGVNHTLKSLGCTAPEAVSAPARPPSAGSFGASTSSSSSEQAASAAALTQSLGQLEARARAVVAVWSTVMGKAGSVPGAQAMVKSQMNSSMSREAGAAAAAASSSILSADGASTSSRQEQESPLDPPKQDVLSRSSAGAFASAPRSLGVGGGSGKQQQQKFGNQLFDDSGSEEDGSEDEAPLTRDQIQDMRLAAGTSGA